MSHCPINEDEDGQEEFGTMVQDPGICFVVKFCRVHASVYVKIMPKDQCCNIILVISATVVYLLRCYKSNTPLA